VNYWVRFLLEKRELQGRIAKHGTTFKLELRWNGVRE